MSLSLSQIFNTSLAEPVPEGYEDVTDIVPPYSAFSAKGQPEVMLEQTNTDNQHEIKTVYSLNPGHIELD